MQKKMGNFMKFILHKDEGNTYAQNRNRGPTDNAVYCALAGCNEKKETFNAHVCRR